MIFLLQIRKTTDFLIFVLRQVFAIFLEVGFTFRFNIGLGFCCLVNP